MKRKWIRFASADIFLLGTLVIVLVAHYSHLVPGSIDRIALAVLAGAATIPVLLSAYQSLKNKKISVDLLASVALLVSLLTAQWASAAFINLMLTSARIFDSYTQNRARRAIKSLMKLRPEKVKVKKGNEIVEESIINIKKDDLIVVELGERVPVDGIIVSGTAQIDQSSLTGESLPIEKKIGDEVLSSTMNVSGSLVIRAEKVGEDTTFEKIIKLVEASQKDKAGIQTTADRFTTWYITLTFLGAVVVYVFTRNLNLVLALLLVTCADDIAVAIPIAFSAGIASAARRGIIIKGGSFLEGLTQVKTVIVDKTGTLTRGMLKVDQVYALSDQTEERVASLAASADFFSSHPVARAVIRYVTEKNIVFEKTDDFKEYSGMGSSAQLHGKRVVSGKLEFLRHEGVTISSEQEKEIEKIREKGTSSLLPVAYGGKLIGLIILADEIRPETKATVAKLRSLGVDNIVMLTGDNEQVAAKVSSAVGLTAYHANLLPEDKIAYVKKYLNNENKVAMIGDGVNDAAALALADIGIAMGALGTDAAIEAADIALMKDDLAEVSEALELGHSVTRISHQDFWIWGIVNAVGLGLVFAHIIGPEGAAAFNFITDFFPLLNSVRVFGYKFQKHFAQK